MMISRSLTDRFLLWGARVFAPGKWHKVSFQPILYLFSWGAILRISISDDMPIRFDQIQPVTYATWQAFGLTAPPLALLSWWLICRCNRRCSSCLGIHLRLAADIMQFSTLLTFHIAGILNCIDCNNMEMTVYRRYLVAAGLVFIFALIIRDIWVIVLSNRVARQISQQRDAELSDG
jgi:hypothetical protein